LAHGQTNFTFSICKEEKIMLAANLILFNFAVNNFLYA